MGKTRSAQREANDRNAHLWSLIYIGRRRQIRHRSTRLRRRYSGQIHWRSRLHVVLRGNHSLIFYAHQFTSYASIKKKKKMPTLFQICEFLRVENTTLVWDNEQQVPFAYRGDQWVGFDDERSLKTKVSD